mmetsp:Transcript_37163/g.64177  ORF Transcript_37163/g.64177 Transcript_37163/m.64177 type:complete len:269 (-) Transcript_37163:230-1036(-)
MYSARIARCGGGSNGGIGEGCCSPRAGQILSQLLNLMWGREARTVVVAELTQVTQTKGVDVVSIVENHSVVTACDNLGNDFLLILSQSFAEVQHGGQPAIRIGKTEIEVDIEGYQEALKLVHCVAEITRSDRALTVRDGTNARDFSFKQISQQTKFALYHAVDHNRVGAVVCYDASRSALQPDGQLDQTQEFGALRAHACPGLESNRRTKHLHKAFGHQLAAPQGLQLSNHLVGNALLTANGQHFDERCKLHAHQIAAEPILHFLRGG